MEFQYFGAYNHVYVAICVSFAARFSSLCMRHAASDANSNK